jgi:ABC-type transport system involved in cytochrome bd biosynthesis fused ATPase/permease subunit
VLASTSVDLARTQFATTSLYHFLFVPLTLGLAIAGRDLREYRQSDVRANFALAAQDAHLFDTSIRANLLIGRPHATDAELGEALRRARLASWVASLPDGLDTQVGEEGKEVSGGQRARLVVARALLADASVLVLDEPTAHLDPETAQGVIEDAVAAAGDRAVLLITHRREGLELMDEIAELPGSATSPPADEDAAPPG